MSWSRLTFRVSSWWLPGSASGNSHFGPGALTQDVAASTNPAEEGLPVGLDKYILGFDTRDVVLNEAGQILHLLHIEELRELQTKIHAARVAVQVITADPKTDH